MANEQRESTSATQHVVAAPSKTLEQLLAENEQLREERRLLLQAMFPPQPEEQFDPTAYFPVTAEELLAAAHKPLVP